MNVGYVFVGSWSPPRVLCVTWVLISVPALCLIFFQSFPLLWILANILFYFCVSVTFLLFYVFDFVCDLQCCMAAVEFYLFPEQLLLQKVTIWREKMAESIFLETLNLFLIT